jgi:hypothetical protein
MAGAVAAPVSLFWVSTNSNSQHVIHQLTIRKFAWTNSPSIHWIVSIIAGAPFGFALVVIFQGINNYLVDSYLIYSASVLAGTAIIRSVFATVFPLFTGKMYEKLGIHWASCVPAFLALAFTPFPFLLYKYGPYIRAKCKYSAEAQALMKQLQSQAPQPVKVEATEPEDNTHSDELRDAEIDDTETEKHIDSDRKSKD